MPAPRKKSIKVRQRSTTSRKTSTKRKNRRAATKSYEMCHKVLNTSELLEMILLEVFDSKVPDVTAQKALLKIQKVSHLFEDAIKGSVKLQRALCFLSDPGMTSSSDKAFVSPLLLPYEESSIHRPIFSYVEDSNNYYFGPSIGSAFASKVTDKRLAPKKFESWQMMLVMQGAKEDYWVTLARLPFLGLVPKHYVDVKCSPDTTAGELMRLAREKFWNNGIRDIDMGPEANQKSEAAGGSEENAIEL